MKRPISAIYDMTPEEFDRHLRRNARLSAKAKARRLARIEAEECVDDSPQLDKLCPEMLWSRRGRG
jgi:hypothetical protein